MTATFHENRSLKSLVYIIGFIVLIALDGAIGTSLVSIDKVSDAIQRQWEDYGTNAAEKGLILSRLNGQTGYGGFIHHFKNYVIRHDEDYRKRSAEDYERSVAQIAAYRSLPLSDIELAAIDTITQTLKEYRDKLDLAENLIGDGKSTEEIDWSVKVDDTAALAAFDKLEEEWFEQHSSGTKRMSASVDESHRIVRVVQAVLISSGFTLLLAVVIIWRLDRKNLSLFEALNESRERFRGIFEGSADAIITITDKGIVEDFNPAATKLFGYSPDEIAGKNVSFLMPPEEREEHERYLEKSNLHEARIINRPRDLEGRGKDGGIFPISLNVAPFVVRGVKRYIGVIRNISARRQAEKGLMQAKLDAEAASQSKDRFVANVSHELRTPLNAVIGYAQMIASPIMEKLPRDKYIEYANDIQKAGRHLYEIISDVLDLSRIEEGRLELFPEPKRVSLTIDETVSILKREGDERGVRIVTAIDTDDDLLSYDPTRIRQVMLNIIGNAIKFTPPNGEVRITLEDSGPNFVKITVKDTGPGVPPDEIRSILKPFHRMNHHTKSEVEGTGLGLPISKHLVECHGGKLKFESEVGVGSTVTIKLPRNS